MNLPYLYAAQYPPPDRPVQRSQQHSPSRDPAQIPAHGRPSAPDDPSISARTKRGNKPFDLPPEVEEGLMRFLVYLDIPFDTIADAVTASTGGPKKGMLRKWFQRITGTNKVDKLRLRKNAAEAADERLKIQEEFINARASGNVPGPAVSPVPNFDPASTEQTTFASTHNRKPNHNVPSATQSRVDTGVINEDGVQQWLSRGQDAMDPPERQETLDTGRFNIFGADFAFAEKDAAQGSEPPLEETRFDMHPPTRRVTFDDLPSTDTAEEPASELEAHQSWPMKRQKTADSDGDEPKLSYVKRRKLATRISLRSITNHLVEKFGHDGLVRHYATTRSTYAETIASVSRAPTSSGAFRADGSTQSIVHGTPQTLTEYEEFYHKPNIQEGSRGRSLGDLSAVHDQNSLTVTSLLIEARLQRLSDEHVFDWLKECMPTGSERQTWVNVRDERGVSGLHLSAAYGFLKSSHLLCAHGADLKARTKLGTTVQHFAKPAQNLARQDRSLWHRITVCRTFIRRNKSPPMPTAKNNESSAQRSEADPVSSDPVQGRGYSRATTTTSSAYSDAVSEPLFPEQAYAHIGGVASNVFQADQWFGDGAGFTHDFSVSPLSMNRRRGTMNSNDLPLDRSRARHGGRPLQRAVVQRNLNRALTMAPSQQHGSQFTSPTTRPRFAAPAGMPSGMTNLHPSASQSVPNLGYHRSPLAAYPVSSYDDPHFMSSVGVATSDTFNGLATSTTDASMFEPDHSSSTVRQPNIPLNALAPPESLAIGDFAPLPLVPQGMQSMQTYNNNREFQAFPIWPESGQGVMQPTIQPPPQQTYIGLPPGLAPVTSRQLGTQAPTIPPRAAGANDSEPSRQIIWINCPHNRPVSNEETYCHSCRALNRM